jgi:hypothetical protein
MGRDWSYPSNGAGVLNLACSTTVWVTGSEVGTVWLFVVVDVAIAVALIVSAIGRKGSMPVIALRSVASRGGPVSTR